jgi:hypothetical protein
MIVLIFFKIKTITHLFFYGAGCGTDKMKINLSHAFQEYSRMLLFLWKRILMQRCTQPPKKEKAIVSILGTGSNCSYFDGKELHQKYNH